MGIEGWKLLVSILGFAGTITTIALAIRQYRRAEQWKRGEFIANEVKEFEEDPAVRAVYAAIDWSERPLNLTGDPAAERARWTLVTRDFLWRALLPHEINARHPEWRPTDRKHSPESQHGQLVERESSPVDILQDGEGLRAQFTRASAVVRDTFDIFFDKLGRFGNFIEAGLITADEIRPYVSYWLTDLTTDQGSKDDARWRCAVLTYLFAYKFQGAVTIFRACGHDIDPYGELFSQLHQRMENESLFKELRDTAAKESKAMLDHAEKALARQRQNAALFPT